MKNEIPQDTDIDPGKAEQLANIERMLGDDFEPAADKPKAAPVAEEDPESAEMIAELLHLAFAVKAARHGEHWLLSEKEATTLGLKTARVLDKYMPAFEAGPEAALIVSCLIIIGPRVAIDMRRKGIIEGETEKADGDQPESRAA